MTVSTLIYVKYYSLPKKAFSTVKDFHSCFELHISDIESEYGIDMGKLAQFRESDEQYTIFVKLDYILALMGRGYFPAKIKYWDFIKSEHNRLELTFG